MGWLPESRPPLLRERLRSRDGPHTALCIQTLRADAVPDVQIISSWIRLINRLNPY